MRIDFASGASLGPGKIALLERIAATGSLSQAARELGLSYRRGWVLLNDVNTSFGAPVVVTAIGGASGGGATLTPLGLEIIKRYRNVESAAEKVASQQFRGLASNSVGALADSGAKRRPLSRRLKGKP